MDSSFLGCCMRCVVDFSSKWIRALDFERALQTCRATDGPLGGGVSSVVFKLSQGCKMMVDAALQLLCLANQLDHLGRSIRIEFEEETGVMGYLDRMGFFDHLAHQIEVAPYRPLVSRAKIYRGTSGALVEIARISPECPDEELPGRLADVLKQACSNRRDVKSLSRDVFTVFGELISNIYEHSATELDGYAALQLYTGGGFLKVSVSDSGLGILETLRPTLRIEEPKLFKLGDIDLMVEVLRQGISRHGKKDKRRGMGLKGSALHALKYKAKLDVRLPRSRVLLVPSSDGYKPNLAYCYDSLPKLLGTHICFDFELDAAR